MLNPILDVWLTKLWARQDKSNQQSASIAIQYLPGKVRKSKRRK